jgi:hypothetical protein
MATRGKGDRTDGAGAGVSVGVELVKNRVAVTGFEYRTAEPRPSAVTTLRSLRSTSAEVTR